MMRHLTGAALAVSLLASVPAHAALVTFDFTSVQNGFVPGAPIPNGQAFSGSVTFDTSVTGVFPPFDPFTNIYGGAIKSFNLDGLFVDVSGWSTNRIKVSSPHGFASATTFDFLASIGGATIELDLASSTISDPDFALPTTLPDITAFDRAKSLDFGDGSGTANDTLTSIGTGSGTAPGSVPEPSSLLVLLSGAFILARFARPRIAPSRASAVVHTVAKRLGEPPRGNVMPRRGLVAELQQRIRLSVTARL